VDGQKWGRKDSFCLFGRGFLFNQQLFSKPNTACREPRSRKVNIWALFQAMAELQTVHEEGGGGKVSPDALQLAGLVFAAAR